jgi:hypothetical protein
LLLLVFAAIMVLINLIKHGYVFFKLKSQNT